MQARQQLLNTLQHFAYQKNICVAAVDIEKYVTHGSYQSCNFLRALFSKTLQHFSQWCECLVTLIQFHLTNTFKFNKNTSVTSKYMAQLSLQLTLNVFNLLMHCSIQTCSATAHISSTISHSFLSSQSLTAALVFMVHIDYLISQIATLQVLVSKHYRKYFD